MKKSILSIAGILALMVTVGGATGYAQDRVEASVPFGFSVGQAALPAGNYSFRQLSQNSWAIRNTDSGKSVLAIGGPSESHPTDDQGKLVFKHYGSHYFLYEISRLGQSQEIPPSKQEREMAREMARNGVHPEYARVLASAR